MFRGVGAVPGVVAALAVLLAVLAASDDLARLMREERDGVVLAVSADELRGGGKTADAMTWKVLQAAGVGALVMREYSLADAAAAGELSVATGSEILAGFRLNAVIGGYLFEQLRPEHIIPEATYVFTGQRNREAVRARLRAEFGDSAVVEPGRQRWSADYRIIAVAAARAAVERVALRPPQLPAWTEGGTPRVVMQEPLLPESRQSRDGLLRLIPDGVDQWWIQEPGGEAPVDYGVRIWQARAAAVPLAEWPARAVRLAGYDRVRLVWLRLPENWPLPEMAAAVRAGRAALAAAGFAADDRKFTMREISGGGAGPTAGVLAMAGFLFSALTVLLTRCWPRHDLRVITIVAGLVLAVGYFALAGRPAAPVIWCAALLVLMPPAIICVCTASAQAGITGGRGTLLLLARTLLALLLALAAGLMLQLAVADMSEGMLAAHRPLLAGAAIMAALLAAVVTAGDPLAALRSWLARPLTGGTLLAGLLAALAAPAFAARFMLQPPQALAIGLTGSGIAALAWHYLAVLAGRRAAAGWLALPAGLGLATLLSLFAQPQALPWLVWRQVAVALAPGLAALPLALLLAVGWLGQRAKWRDIAS